MMIPTLDMPERATYAAERARDEMPTDEYAAALQRLMDCPPECTCRGITDDN